MVAAVDQQRVESLGPAERIIQALITHTDHLVHNRPGMVSADGRTTIGVRWVPVTWRQKDGHKVVYQKNKVGRKTREVEIGVLRDDGRIFNGRRKVGEYRKPGLFPEAVAWFYKQVAEVWKLDNDFAAHWASWAFPRDHKDMKVVLAAFMLVQNRVGDPVMEDGEVLFHDDDYRAIGEAMCLLRPKTGGSIDPKLLLRIGDVLALPGVADINRKLGFGRSARRPPTGRYPKAVAKYLRYRENNPKMLQGLIDAGFKRRLRQLAQRIGYKPQSPKFFEMLRWKQTQADDGRRTMAIGKEVKKAETWEGLTEEQICQRIVKDKPNYKRIVGLLPADVGLTRAIMAAAIEAGSVSNADLIIFTPTLEELGLLEISAIKQRWQKAVERAENQRAANVAQRVRDKKTAEKLEEGADKATQKAIEEVAKDIRTYVIIDKSGSMDVALDKAKEYLTKFLGGFPLDRTHVSIFDTIGREITLKGSSAKAVKHAFRGIRAGGGTTYGQGVRALSHVKPKDDEDVLMVFVGDQADHQHSALYRAIEASGFRPVAFGLLEVLGSWGDKGTIVEDTASLLGIPCFRITKETFDDPYAVTRTIRNLIASTPVRQTQANQPQPRRKPLIEEILSTPLLTKPVWA